METLANEKTTEENQSPLERVPALLELAADTFGEQVSKIPLIHHGASYFYHSAYP